MIVAAKQKVTFTGSLTNGPTQVSGQTFPRMHEGHDGWTIDPGYSMIGSSYGGISSLVPSPALNGNPHIVLLHIGTNDPFAMDSANMSTRLEALIDKVAANAPNALIVLAQITPLGTTDAALTTYNSRIPGIVQSHAAKGQHIIGVDMSKLPVLRPRQRQRTPTIKGTRTWRASGTRQSKTCCRSSWMARRFDTSDRPASSAVLKAVRSRCAGTVRERRP